VYLGCEYGRPVFSLILLNSPAKASRRDDERWRFPLAAPGQKGGLPCPILAWKLFLSAA